MTSEERIFLDKGTSGVFVGKSVDRNAPLHEQSDENGREKVGLSLYE
jgi:hypothetical protein